MRVGQPKAQGQGIGSGEPLDPPVLSGHPFHVRRVIDSGRGLSCGQKLGPNSVDGLLITRYFGHTFSGYYVLISILFLL